MKKKLHIFIILILIASNSYSQWESNIVKFGANGKLVYTSDAEGNKIPDFSLAGYKNGKVAIPNVTVQKTISPVAGDNTANIQNAINTVAARTPDANGIRGAVLMNAGKYYVSGTIRINASGVVLRGVGDGSDSLTNTIIASTGTKTTQPTVIIAGGGNDGSGSSAWSDKSGSNVNITDAVVYVGAKTFTVASTSGFAVGNNIIIVHPKTTAWVNAVDNGGTGDTLYWKSESLDIKYNRYITAINGSTITIDAPIFNTLKKSLSQSYFYKTTRTGILTNIGIENLRVDIKNPLNELPTNSNGDVNNHSAYGIWLGKIQDSWVKNATVLHFSNAGIQTSIATRVTIDSCKVIDPIGKIAGGYRYNFCSEWASQLILISNSYASYGRHCYVSNGTSTVSGIVVYKFRADYNYTSSEGHRLWSQGLLFDNWTNTNSFNNSEVAAFYNRGNYGSGHGWSAAHSVIWGGTVTGLGNFSVQKPPTAQNYAIGCMASVLGTGPFAGPAGYIEGANVPGINPASLYLAQWIETNAIPVTGVTVSPATASVSVGGTLQLTATVVPSNATNKVVTWTTSNAAFATVSTSGLVTAVATGTATITVTTQDGGKIATSVITVVIPVTGVTVSPAIATVLKGAKLQLTATVAPANATNKVVSWKTSNAAFVTVSTSGLVTAVATGTATITATTQDGGKIATSVITVGTPVTGVTVSPATATLSAGGTLQLTATVAPTNATNKIVIWTTSNAAFATVSTSGLVTAVAAGTATITATTQDGGKTSTSSITVSQSFTRTLDPSADVNVFGGAATTNYGTAGSLTVKEGINKPLLVINDLINSKTNKQLVIVSPNPLNQDILTIKLEGYEKSDKAEVIIFNLQGLEVYRSPIPENKRLEINSASLLKSTIYIVSIRSGNSIRNTKLIVN